MSSSRGMRTIVLARWQRARLCSDIFVFDDDGGGSDREATRPSGPKAVWVALLTTVDASACEPTPARVRVSSHSSSSSSPTAHKQASLDYHTTTYYSFSLLVRCRFERLPYPHTYLQLASVHVHVHSTSQTCSNHFPTS